MSTPNYRRRQRLYYIARQQTCAGPCGKRLCFEETTLDHIFPKSLGGGNSYVNLQIMCGPCNKLKGNSVEPAYC